jgi:hypothetical protein
MPQTLDQFPTMTRNARYPWERYLNGEIWQAFAGADFTCKPQTFIANVRHQAKRRGGSVRTRMLNEDGRESVVLQYRQN